MAQPNDTGVSVPAQTELSKSGPLGILRAVLLASQGVEPVEANANFIAEIDAVAGEALVACQHRAIFCQR